MRDSGGFVVVGHPTTTPLLVVRGLWDTHAAPEKNGCSSFRALRTERCPRFPAVFACITPRAACATCIQPYRACWILENHVRSGKKNSQPLWDISKLSSQIA